jgi:endoglucanase
MFFMKRPINYLGIITLVLFTGFSLTLCSNRASRPSTGGGNNISNNDARYVNNDNSHVRFANNTFTSAQPFNDITAVELVANIKIGWNLGNTFDAGGNTATGFSWLGGGIYANTSVDEMERAWVNHTTTRENIDAIKNAGFNTIRIPVTWYKACDADFNIRADWMERITEVVNYAVANDLYIILNTHHDETIFKFDNASMNESLRAFRTIWEQIAENFKHYNEKLIFEGLNEPRTRGSQSEWSGGTHQERVNLNRYYQVFVDTVRATGSNNARRKLMITPYAASAEAAAMNGLTLPNDTAPNKLIVSVHFYSPYNFALNTNRAFNSWSLTNSRDTSPIIDILTRIHSTFVRRGIPVIIGEFGAMSKDNESTRAVWAEFTVREARSRGLPCVWWDNGAVTGTGELFGLLNRRDNTFYYPLIVDALMRGAGM